MGISEKDKTFMNEVAAYFRSTKNEKNAEGSIRETSNKFGISRNKVRKILITTGDLNSEITEKAKKLRLEGFSIEEIAEKLDVSVATVSIYLPYTETIKDGLDPNEHTKAVREYRAYEKKRVKKLVRNVCRELDDKADTSWKDEWKKEIAISFEQSSSRPQRVNWDDVNTDINDYYDDPLIKKVIQIDEDEEKKELEELDRLCKKEEKGDLPDNEKDHLYEIREKRGLIEGTLTNRRIEDLEKISGERIPFEPRDVVRLHLELVDDINDEDRERLKGYGGLKYGDHISRDVVVPYDMPLYAIHYMIQRLFGWQNSHFHKFEFPNDVFMRITENNTAIWTGLVGILFRSPFMDREEEFWADDYKGGSFKNWLTRKYTGPYVSQCHGEGLVSCKETMNEFIGELLLDREYYVLYDSFGGKEKAVCVSP